MHTMTTNKIKKSTRTSGKAWTREDSSKRSLNLKEANEKRMSRIKAHSKRGCEFSEDFNSSKNECSHELMKIHKA